MNEDNKKPDYPCGRAIYERCFAEIIELRKHIEYCKGKLEVLCDIKYRLEEDWGFSEQDID